jgi:hypothetical protein
MRATRGHNAIPVHWIGASHPDLSAPHLASRLATFNG